jgi:predicted nucleotidyltransferase
METQFKNRNDIINDIKSFIKAIEGIEFSYIFGSFALLEKESPSNDTFNDIDIAIYVSQDISIDFLQFELEMEERLESLIHIRFDVRVLNGAPLPFQYNVLKSGILILDKNNLLRSDFENLTLKKYYDYVHLRNEYLREIPNAPI